MPRDEQLHPMHLELEGRKRGKGKKQVAPGAEEGGELGQENSVQEVGGVG